MTDRQDLDYTEMAPRDVLLYEELKDPETARTYLEILQVGNLLSNCYIDKNYIVPDALARPIRLTEVGEEVQAAYLAKKPRTKPNELKMALFLTFGFTDGLLASTLTDIDTLRRGISGEIRRRRLHFPFIFGRELHDKAAEMFPGRTSLRNKETLDLLRSLPVGVFQGGRTLVGPFGCLTSDSSRIMGPQFGRVPGYLCSDITCETTHSIELTTGDSSIAKLRRSVSDFLAINYSGSSDNVQLINRAILEVMNNFSNESPEALIEVIADGLTSREAESLCDSLLRRTFRHSRERQGELSRKLGVVVGNPTEFSQSLDRPSLLQVIMLHSDRLIVQCLDEAVYSGVISIPDFELRRAKLRRWSSGKNKVIVEIGSNGVRYTAPRSTGYVAKRLHELLHHLYYSDSGPLEPKDLQYALDQPDGLSEQELLGYATHQLEPEALLKDLVLGSRKPAVAAADFLGVIEVDSSDRHVLLRRMLWKLGASTAGANFDDLGRIENQELTLTRLTQAESAIESDLRGAISNLFTAMEDALSRALIFSIWALTTDHFLAEDSFKYDPKMSAQTFTYLARNAPVSDPDYELKLDGKNTLTSLASGFSRLAKVLTSLDERANLRADYQTPSECRATTKPFAFRHTVPFLDLTEKGKSSVLNTLQEVGKLLQDSNVVAVRNATLHGNNEFPSRSEILVALERVAALRKVFGDSGLYPQVFTLDSTLEDSFGRTLRVYRNGQTSVELRHPTWAVAPGLPIVPRVVLLPTATLASAGPLRFRISGRPGEDPYWKGWPKRWRVVEDYSRGTQEDGEVQTASDIPAASGD